MCANNNENKPIAHEKFRLHIIDYSKSTITEKDVNCAEDCAYYIDTKTVTWIDVVGLKDAKLMEAIGRNFNLHPLVMDDIIHTRQRPKLEDYEDYLYIVVRMLLWNPEKNCAMNEQISLILGKGYVISFQENEGDVFDRVREYLRRDKGKIRRLGPDFLAYSLIDAVVDNYYTILERAGEKIEDIETTLMKSPNQKILHSIRKLKQEILSIRRSVWPLREVVLSLERESMNKKPLVTEETALYFRDVYDHTVQVVDTVETYRDSMSGMLDIYLSTISNRLNEVMKVLTIIGTIFIPLTFITGIYGMNFEFMPELGHPLGYAAVWVIMILLILVMIAYFKIKKWI